MFLSFARRRSSQKREKILGEGNTDKTVTLKKPGVGPKTRKKIRGVETGEEPQDASIVFRRKITTWEMGCSHNNLTWKKAIKLEHCPAAKTKKGGLALKRTPLEKEERNRDLKEIYKQKNKGEKK